MCFGRVLYLMLSTHQTVPDVSDGLLFRTVLCVVTYRERSRCAESQANITSCVCEGALVSRGGQCQWNGWVRHMQRMVHRV